jgi:AbrB family looped-hinge helix DNA binding protein
LLGIVDIEVEEVARMEPMPRVARSRSIWYSYYGEVIDMDSVTLSPKYQVVIPRRIRERLGLKPGIKLQVISLDDRIELVPIRPMRAVRGFLRGLDPCFEREQEERC